MRIDKAMWMSIGMFSAFPTPANTWDDAYMPLAVPFFPLVGALIGGAWYGAARLLLLAQMPLPVQAALGGLVPFLLSGGLHLDGLMDTADAVLSRRGPEERRRILKDPHVGAFAVVALACLFVTHFAAYYAVIDEGKALLGILFVCVVSRAATGLFLLNSRPLFETGYVAAFRKNARPVHTLWLVGIAALACVTALLSHIRIFASCAATLAAALAARKYLLAKMQGLSGDLCGCILTIAEMCGMLCLAAL